MIKSKKGNVKLNLEANRPLSDVSSKKDRRTIQMFLNRMTQGNGEIDARAAHQLKKDIQNTVDFNNPNKVGAEVDPILKELQRGLNDTIRSANDNYAKTNDNLSGIIGSTNEIEKLFRGVDETFEASAQGVGLALRKLDTNYAASPKMLNALAKIDQIARKNQIKFNDDIAQQVTLARELENVLDLTPRGTFTKQTQQGTEKALNNAVQFAADPVFTGTQKAAKWYDSMRGRNPRAALQSINDLLNE